MKTLVIDVAASSGGAMTILRRFYKKFTLDKDEQYVLCVSSDEFTDSSNVSVRRYPNVKRSWLHRAYFDLVTVPRILKKEKIDRVFSLQNTAVPTRLPISIYLHQPLPYCGIKISFFKDKKLWFVQNVIGAVIHSSVKKADSITVQTKWMKDAVIKKDKIAPNKIRIETPDLDKNLIKPFDPNKFDNAFFYPADNTLYKNHDLIYETAAYLHETGFDSYKIVLTLDEKELTESQRAMIAQCRDRFVFIGRIPYERVTEEYTRSALLFPSYVETYGLPLAEARSAGCPIAASDTPFAHEILDDYYNKILFDPFDASNCANAILKIAKEYETKTC